METSTAPLELATLMLDVVPMAMREFRKDLHGFRGSKGIRVTVVEFRLLANLYWGAANNKTLAELAGLSIPSTSRAVASLTKRGLIARAKTKKDKRIVLMELTPKGRALVDERRARLTARMAERIGLAQPDAALAAEAGLRALREILLEEVRMP